MSKINKVQTLTKWGQYPIIFNDCINAIPTEILKVLTAKQIALLIDANQKIYEKGKLHNQNEMNIFLGYDFWATAEKKEVL